MILSACGLSWPSKWTVLYNELLRGVLDYFAVYWMNLRLIGLLRGVLDYSAMHVLDDSAVDWITGTPQLIGLLCRVLDESAVDWITPRCIGLLCRVLDESAVDWITPLCIGLLCHACIG